MKLLADQPTVDVEEPPHRPVFAILGGVGVLIVMIGVGLVLLLRSGGGGDDQPPPPAVEEAAPQAITMEDWTVQANSACRAAGNAPHVATADESMAEVDQAVRNLTVSIREIPIPADRQARALILPIVMKGDEAETAWAAISGLPSDEVTPAELNTANTLTQAFVNGLVDIGADCGSLAQ